MLEWLALLFVLYFRRDLIAAYRYYKQERAEAKYLRHMWDVGAGLDYKPNRPHLRVIKGD